MKRPRKTALFVVKLAYPGEMSRDGAKRELRSLINEQCNVFAEPGDLKVKGIQ